MTKSKSEILNDINDTVSIFGYFVLESYIVKKVEILTVDLAPVVFKPIRQDFLKFKRLRDRSTVTISNYFYRSL